MTTQVTSTGNSKGQYTLLQILGVWLAAGAPMWLLGWVAYSAMSTGLPPADAALLRIKLTVGLIWQFVLAMIILYREQGNIRLSTISRRFWLNHPISAQTGKTQKSLWWWIVPLVLVTAVMELTLRPPLVKLWTTIFPFFTEPKGYDFGKWDWVANGVIFGFYHLHQPWGILGSVTTGMLFAFCGKRYRSNWFPIILHSGQSILFLFLILGLALGLV